MITFRYKPDGTTLKGFLHSDRFVRGLRGPIGSGKSAACCVEIFRRALAMPPWAGPKKTLRRSRWAVVRNSYPELRTTTMNTWKGWFPEDVWGKVVMHPPPYVHRLQKGDLDLEVLFLALDTPDDVKKLLSLELTGAWLNEARELPKEIIDGATSRVGRYPRREDAGDYWAGVIMDSNAPDFDHWWPIIAGEVPVPDHFSREEALMMVKPDNWEFFTQPGGMVPRKDHSGEVLGYELNPLGENLKYLRPDYYPNLIRGKSADWIRVYVLNQLGALADGKPVYPNYNKQIHAAKDPIPALAGVPLQIGLDFGLTPAAVIGQEIRGRWHLLSELVSTDTDTVEFAQVLKRHLAERFQQFTPNQIKMTGDPAGDFRAQTDKTTPFQILGHVGLKAYPAPSNDPVLRQSAVNATLTRLVDGQPGLLVDPSCVTLLRGFEGGYHYRRLRVSGERYEEFPSKNKFSHVHDALQYALLGGGEGRALTAGQLSKVANGRVPYDPFTRDRRHPRQRGAGV